MRQTLSSRGASRCLVAALLLITASAASGGRSAVIDFPFASLEGQSRTLSELEGNTVLLEFWAPWCVPCRKGFPFLDQLQARHETERFRIVAVALEEDTQLVRSFVAEHPVRFLVGQDASGHSGEMYEVAAMPTAILLDRDGRVLSRFEGGDESVHEAIGRAVDAVLRGEPAPPDVLASKGRESPRGNLRPWQRGYLADPIMNLDGDELTRSMREHVHASKEGAAGDGGVAGGGCGCN